jgi:2-iminobutanoate/2-iminopropanoate deaminase
MDSDGRALKSIEEQTRQTLENLKATLEASGATMEDAVKVTCFLGAQEDFGKMNEVYLSYFTGKLPARSTCITGLAVPGMLLEMECIAYKPKGE